MSNDNNGPDIFIFVDEDSLYDQRRICRRVIQHIFDLQIRHRIGAVVDYSFYYPTPAQEEPLALPRRICRYIICRILEKQLLARESVTSQRYMDMDEHDDGFSTHSVDSTLEPGAISYLHAVENGYPTAESPIPTSPRPSSPSGTSVVASSCVMEQDVSTWNRNLLRIQPLHATTEWMNWQAGDIQPLRTLFEMSCTLAEEIRDRDERTRLMRVKLSQLMSQIKTQVGFEE